MTEAIFKMDDELSFDYVIPPPTAYGFSVYGKSNCPKCDQLKLELSGLCDNTLYVNCDEYLNADKIKFKRVMFDYMGFENVDCLNKPLYFPVVFYNKEYISNYYRFFDK